MKNVDKLFALAEELEQKIHQKDDSNVFDQVKRHLYKMNIPMVELANIVDVLLAESKSQLDSGNLDTTKYDLAVELNKLVRQYSELFRQFK